MDEERESLRRQIHLLQDLINSHKKAHGNAPAPLPPASSRWRNPAQPQYKSQGASSRGEQQQQTNQGNGWKQKYSLVNRSGAQPAGPAAPPRPTSGLPPRNPPVVSVTNVSRTANQRVSGNPMLCHDETLAPKGKWQNASIQGNWTQLRPVTDAAVPSTSALRGFRPISPAPAMVPIVSSSKHKTNLSQGTAAAPPPPHTDASRHLPTLSGDASQRRHVLPDFSKTTVRPVTPGKGPKGQRTKYTWVANPAKSSPAARKVSPGAKKPSAGDSEKVKDPVTAAKGKKVVRDPACRYRWRAESAASSSAMLPVTPTQSATIRSTQTPHAKAATYCAGGRDSAPSSYKIKSRTKIVRRRSLSRSPIEKRPSPLAPLTMKSHFSLRRRSSPRVKSPATVKRSSPRGLVHLSKHRLRRLPPSKQLSPGAREAAAASLRSPSSSRVIKTRYRIVKRSVAPPLATSPLSTLSSSLTWRTRLLLLNRMRLLSQRGRLQGQQRWRSRGLCFIGGVMYRVSANKLSKTWSPGTGNKQTPRAGKHDVGSTSPGSLYHSRSATPSRYIASRAVQRSLAIIRQAQHKKEKKEYCMYYNRFGRCNRGHSCPFIHDPEKVAVCTRFLRGTCKKTDGTCPFSHKVSKEKMPVCSYFLKGICHNNDCPYSHVYVSRKAEVCPDFLKGYCPMGAKCKKKHTLLCPDYARDGTCPRGSKCKLQHRQRKRWNDSSAKPPPTNSTTLEDSGLSRDQCASASASDVLSASEEEIPGSSGSEMCPSFISLNCSSTSNGTPVPKKAKPAEDTGKPLQIKPRL